MTDTAIPTIYQHPKVADWGRGVVFAEHLDRRDFIFEDGKTRVFKNDGFPLLEVTLPSDEAAAIAKTLRGKRAATAAPKKKSAPRKPSVRKAIVETITFAQQLEIFKTLFPEGFNDPKFVAQERGADAAGKEPAIALAQQLFARPKLEAQLAAGEFSAVFDSAKRLVDMTKNMLHPSFEAIDFKEMPAETHEAFARALALMLHGDGDYAPRFDAFATALATKRPYWTAATIFAALYRPQEFFFAKPKWEQQQARILKLEEPPSGQPTHAGYALYAAVGVKVREELKAAGHTPRDLIDVYSFVVRTLGDKLAKPAKPEKPAAPKAADPTPTAVPS